MALKYIKRISDKLSFSTATHCSIFLAYLRLSLVVYVYKIHLSLENIVRRHIYGELKTRNDEWRTVSAN